jgi:Trk K+ transport system NAD-binding subunit
MSAHMIVVGTEQVDSSVAESLADDHGAVVVNTDDGCVESPTRSLDVPVIGDDETPLATLRETDVDAVTSRF